MTFSTFFCLHCSLGSENGTMHYSCDTLSLISRHAESALSSGGNEQLGEFIVCVSSKPWVDPGKLFDSSNAGLSQYVYGIIYLYVIIVKTTCIQL